MRIRRTEPGKTNLYYKRQADGGYNPSIKGSPQDPYRTALPNCVGYAVGRYDEWGAAGECSSLPPCAACSMMKYTKGRLKQGKTPKLGACMCWEGGSDGCGHVAIVEQIIDNNTLIVSESVYGGQIFRYRKIKKSENWGLPSSYKLQGFVYNRWVSMKCVLQMRKLLAQGKNDKDYDFDNDGKVTMKDLLLILKSIY